MQLGRPFVPLGYVSVREFVGIPQRAVHVAEQQQNPLNLQRMGISSS